MADINGDQQIQNTNNQVPPEAHNLNYYQEYCRLFIANMKELMTEKESLNEKISHLDKRINEFTSKDNSDEKKHRIRRIAKNIERHYKCPVQTCQKQYGFDYNLKILLSTEGSLNQHLKLKHPDVYAQTVKVEEEDKLKNSENLEEEEEK